LRKQFAIRPASDRMLKNYQMVFLVGVQDAAKVAGR
jgi:hypothetical protein